LQEKLAIKKALTSALLSEKLSGDLGPVLP